MLFVRPLAVALSVVLAGCAAIPELQFDDDGGDAGAMRIPKTPSDASFSIDDAAADAAPVVPESDDASQSADTSLPPSPPPSPPPPPAPDAAPPPPAPGCPSATPAGATMCCGLVPCVGNKCAAHCAECVGCAGGVCCVTPNGKTSTCAASVSACPRGD